MAAPTGARDTYEPGHEEAYELPLAETVRKAALARGMVCLKRLFCRRTVDILVVGALVTEIGVIADTHGWLPPEALQGVALILHAGDVGDPCVVTALEAVAPVRVVGGNCDMPGRWPDAVDQL